MNVLIGYFSAFIHTSTCRKQKKELGKLKAPPEYSLPVDFNKVVLTPINAWVMKRVQELLKGLEDEVLVGTIVESLKEVRHSHFTGRCSPNVYVVIE